MPRHHFQLPMPAASDAPTVRVWFDLYWGRLHWVARVRGAHGCRSFRGSVTTSVPRYFLALLRGIVEHEVGVAAQAALPAAAPRASLAAAAVPRGPAVPHPPRPPDAAHGIWWPHPESWYLNGRLRAVRRLAPMPPVPPSPTETAARP